MFAGDEFQRLFTTRHHGLRANTDALPTVLVIRNGIDTTIPVDVVNQLRIGEYRYRFTLPSNWNAGDVIEGLVTFSIDNIEDTYTLFAFTLQTASPQEQGRLYGANDE